MREILNKFLNLSKNTRFLAVVGLSCQLLSTFFTYIKHTILGLAVKTRLIEYLEGWLIIILITLNLIFIFKDYLKKYVPKLFENSIGKKVYSVNEEKWILIPVVLIIIFSFTFKNKIDNIEFLNITYGLGFYLMWLGVISLVAYAFMYKNDKIKTLDVTPKQDNNANLQPTINITNVPNPESQSSYIVQENDTNTILEQSNQVFNSSTVENKNHKFCINCGTKCDISATKCPACGKDF